MNFNSCTLVGRMVRDPEIKDVGNTQVVSFTIATNRSFKKRDGEKSEKTLFMDCELWGPAASIVSDRGSKGSTILVSGPLEQDTFQTQDGSKRTRYRLRVDFFQFGSSNAVPAGARSGDSFSDDEQPF